MPSKPTSRKKTSSKKRSEPGPSAGIKRGPLAVGLTGNIGSGKSTAARLFVELGVPTFDTDKIGHELLESDPDVRKNISQAFGNEVVENGPVDRHRLGEVVFGDPVKRKKLESILHPAIMASARSRILEYADRSYAIVEVPLLYEAKLAGKFDYVILVKADEDKAVERASANLGIGKGEVKKRLDTQIPQSEKEKLADFVIANNGTEEELRQKVHLLHSVLSSLASERD